MRLKISKALPYFCIQHVLYNFDGEFQRLTITGWQCSVCVRVQGLELYGSDELLFIDEQLVVECSHILLGRDVSTW